MLRLLRSFCRTPFPSPELIRTGCVAVAVLILTLGAWGAAPTETKPAESTSAGLSLPPSKPTELTVPQWRARLPVERVISAASLGHTVYVEGRLGRMLAVNKGTGAVRWQRDLRYPLDYPPILHKKTLYLFAAGRLFAVAPADGRILHRARVRLGIIQKPFVSEGMALVASSVESVHGLSLKTGRPHWTRRIDATPLATAFCPPDMFYAVCDDGVLRSFLVRSGGVAWSKRLRGPTSVAPAVSKNRIYVPGPYLYLYALGARTGVEEWRIALGSPVIRRPQLARGRIFVVAHPDTMLVLKESDGSRLWQVPRIQKLVTTTDDRAYLLCKDETIAVTDLKTGKLLGAINIGAYKFTAADPSGGAIFLVRESGEMLALQPKTAPAARKR